MAVMNADELYDEVAFQFPPSLWPPMPKQRWVNVHDGTMPRIGAIDALLREYLHSASVVVLVRSEPGVAIALPIEAAAHYIAPHVLRYDIQVADLQYRAFVSFSRYGVGTGDS